jgi:hypothetical protein
MEHHPYNSLTLTDFGTSASSRKIWQASVGKPILPCGHMRNHSRLLAKSLFRGEDLYHFHKRFLCVYRDRIVGASYTRQVMTWTLRP